MNILVWLGMVLNYGRWIEFADDDPVSIPILTANKSARNVPIEFKEAVAKLGAAGGIFTSHHHVMRTLKRFRISTAIASLSMANEWHDGSMARYWCACRRPMRGVNGRVIGTSWDGTRLSGLEYIFSLIWCNGQACMAPPMVPRVV